MKPENICRYLRIRGEPDERTLDLIERCMREAEQEIVPRRLYRLCGVRALENGVLIDDVFFEGEKIKKRLDDCHTCALIAVTLGDRCDRLLRRCAVTDSAKAAVMQAVLADMTEDVCDRTQEDIRREIGKAYRLGQRFSPGYPGLPLSYQPLLFSMLDITKRLGVALTDSYLMIPSKSVTAFAPIKEV